MYVGIFSIYFSITKDANLDEAKLPKTYAKVKILDRNGELIENSRYVKLDELPSYVPNAFIAMEDKRFYRHKGVDAIRIIGAAVKDIKTGEYAEGGSTITCQLVKNTHLSNEKTLKRKIQEAKIALQLEKRYSKNEILEMYLNQLYFGKGIYGIGSAANTIFGKETKDLTLSETASLVATIASPARYSPLSDMEANNARRITVLSQMEALNYATKDEVRDAKQTNIIINYVRDYNNYVENLSKLILNEKYIRIGSSSASTARSPIIIETYLDKTLQSHAYAIANKDEDGIEKNILIADNKTGGITTYVGKESPFTSPRQQGSTLKPFIYGAAVNEGRLTTKTQFFDGRKTFDTYSPENYNGIYYGWISAETALSKSSNAVAVEILNETGIDTCLTYMDKCGIRLDKNDRHLALALGGTTYGSTPAELATAYMTLADQGLSKELTFIKRITDTSGRVLYEHTIDKKRAVSASSTYIVTEMLKNTVKTGTASQLSYLSIPIAAKTGTVARGDGNSDAWTIGYTSEHTFLCWYGAKDGEIMPNHITGGNNPAKTMRNVLKHLYYDHSPNDFAKPSTVRYVSINSDIKDRFHAIVPASLFEVGKKEKVPVTENFSFDSIDKGDFYLKDLTFSTLGKELSVKFDRVPNVSYNVYADGLPCEESNGAFITYRKNNAFVKIDILCKHKDKMLFRKSKLIIPY